MIENPKVGLRVWHLEADGVVTVGRIAGRPNKNRHPFRPDGMRGDDWFYADSRELWGSAKELSGHLRAEARRLMDAADKLESEASDG